MAGFLMVPLSIPKGDPHVEKHPCGGLPNLGDLFGGKGK